MHTDTHADAHTNTNTQVYWARAHTHTRTHARTQVWSRKYDQRVIYSHAVLALTGLDVYMLNIDLDEYLVTSRPALHGQGVQAMVETCAEGGCTPTVVLPHGCFVPLSPSLSLSLYIYIYTPVYRLGSIVLSVFPCPMNSAQRVGAHLQCGGFLRAV